ncbi:MAG: T9SS type A sorting domain-containing protein [candidate division Zixibacteria bacterium]|nr:T9SS type A sorting domain-containing protein [candidate division Zixibacteria bacterium]
MTNRLKIAVLAAAIMIIAASPAQSQVPFCIFFDSTTTFDGKPVPVGSIIEAFDQSGISCGKDTVHTAGFYGFFAVLGDDPFTPGIDEGAEAGETVKFKINGRDATVTSGDPTWQNLDTSLVSLSASSISIAITGVSYPGDTLVGFNTTIRVRVGVRNDGDGLDYYGVTAYTSKESWTITPSQTEFVYAEPNDTAFIYFDVEVPLWPGSTLVLISYSVFSYLDTSQHVDSSFNMKSDIAVGIDDEIDGILPSRFVLEQNYPNPFNPTTNIAYTLPFRTDVQLQIYDILGREIESIDLGNKGAGEYIYQFDGSLLASGIYFYRMLTETHSESKKMMLVK